MLSPTQSPPETPRTELRNHHPLGVRKGPLPLQSQPCHCAGKPRGPGSEAGSRRSPTAVRAATAPEPLGHSARGGGAWERRAREPGAYFQEKAQRTSPLPSPPNCPQLEHLPSSSGQSQALASTSASSGGHQTACFRSRQQPPLTELWARPPPSHQTPRSHRQPIVATTGAPLPVT